MVWTVLQRVRTNLKNLKQISHQGVESLFSNHLAKKNSPKYINSAAKIILSWPCILNKTSSTSIFYFKEYLRKFILVKFQAELMLPFLNNDWNKHKKNKHQILYPEFWVEFSTNKKKM